MRYDYLICWATVTLDNNKEVEIIQKVSLGYYIVRALDKGVFYNVSVTKDPFNFFNIIFGREKLDYCSGIIVSVKDITIKFKEFPVPMYENKCIRDILDNYMIPDDLPYFITDTYKLRIIYNSKKPFQNKGFKIEKPHDLLCIGYILNEIKLIYDRCQENRI